MAQQTLPTSFADLVAQRMGELTPSEQRVARYLLDAGVRALPLSAAEIAERIGTSDATVVRTAQSLGFTGLAELRRALAAEQAAPSLEQRLRETLDEAPPGELLASSMTNHFADLDVMARLVPAETFQHAVDLLAGSERVVWRGIGPSAHLAGYGQLLCQRLGHPSAALVHVGTSFADELLALRGDDSVVLLAYGRLQSHVTVLLDRADELGCPVVLVTDHLGRELGERVASVLHCGRGEPGLFSSHAGTLLLVEALVLGIAAADQGRAEGSLSTLNRLRSTVANRRLDVDSF